MYKYREVFYKKYFDNQAGRHISTDIQEVLRVESDHFLYEIIPFFPSDRKLEILDIGCGYGALIHAAHQLGYENIQGIDISPDQVEVAKKLGISGVHCADLLPFLKANPGRFDLICGIDIIEHFGKDELVELLSLVRDSLKPGAKAIFRTPNLDAPLGTMYAYGDFTHENYMNGFSARQVMLSCGFSHVEVYPSKIAIKGLLKQVLQKLFFKYIQVNAKIQLLATGRSSKHLVLTPNMIIEVTR